MESFLTELARDVAANHGKHMTDLCVVFQNRRAVLYFKKCLSEEVREPLWTPAVLTIEEFVLELHPVRIMEPVMLLFEFYQIYRKSGGEETFERFSQWAEVLLKDFDDIDAYMTPADKLFDHLDEIKAIEQWSPDGGSLTDFQMQYLHFWKSLKPWYHRLKEHLSECGMAYKGMAFRSAAESVETLIIDKPWKKVLFAGFNALSHSEEKIFRTLLKMDRAQVIWDIDSYYIDNQLHEAGHYIRRYLKEWRLSDDKWMKSFFTSTKKHIEIIGVGKQIGQAHTAGDIAELIKSISGTLDRTAVILADESLLFPMLHSLPASVDAVNVSMGLSLRHTPLFSLIESLFELQKNAKSMEGNGKTAFYHRDVVSVLGHPLIEWIDSRRTTRPFRNLIRRIRRQNILHIAPDDITAFIKTTEPLYDNILFHVWKDASDAIHQMTLILAYLRQALSGNADFKKDIELESIYAVEAILVQLDRLFKVHETALDVFSFQKLLTNILSSTRIPFAGEPLKGLQIMGVLETRTIDFENVIILSVNESILPAAKTQMSLIPLDIKREFKLPTYKERDAIFAYNFYRSIQRAANVYLIYNTETDEFGKGERSRFITQLLNELPKYNPNIKPSDIPVRFLSGQWSFEDRKNPAAIEIPKDREISERLESLLAAGISPSAFNTFIQCTLRFYFRYAVGIRETEGVEEAIEADTFGNAVHETLRELYQPLLEKPLNEEALDRMRPKIEPLLRQAFLKFLPGADIDHGKNHLLLRVGIKLINRFLQTEKQRLRKSLEENAGLTVIGLEKEMHYDLKLQLNGDEKIIKLKGIIDRIESSSDGVRIVDYKTGKVTDEELVVETWPDIVSDPALSKSLQTLTYAYIYKKNIENRMPNMSAVIYPFKKLSGGLIPVTIEGSTQLTDAVFDSFEEQLRSLIGRIVDPGETFRQTDDEKRCRNCEFITLCRRD